MLAGLLQGTLACGHESKPLRVEQAFASDLMSDVLTLSDSRPMLITGLANLQTIRTAEMADIAVIVLARGKKATPEMLELAGNIGMTIIETPYSVFRASGILYAHGIREVY